VRDVTADVLSGSASFSGSYLTTPDFVADEMAAGQEYKMIVSWTVSGKTVSAYGLDRGPARIGELDLWQV
jgi:hypothetical protein